MIWVVVNKETGGLARYAPKELPWSKEQAEASAQNANGHATDMEIKTRYEAREVEEWR